jgi:hypothetical protein
MAIGRRVWRAIVTLTEEDDQEIETVQVVYYDSPPEDADNPGRVFREEQRGAVELGEDLNLGQAQATIAFVNNVARFIADEKDPINP